MYHNRKTFFPSAMGNRSFGCVSVHVLDPDEWEEGLLVRPFYGKINKNNVVHKDEDMLNGNGNSSNSEAK